MDPAVKIMVHCTPHDKKNQNDSEFNDILGFNTRNNFEKLKTFVILCKYYFFTFIWSF